MCVDVCVGDEAVCGGGEGSVWGCVGVVRVVCGGVWGW